MVQRHEFTDASRGTRLQKVLAEAGVASRRTCEALVTSGAVAVNGIPVTTLPAWVDPAEDRITVHGRRLRTSPGHVYVMLYKPKGVLSTNADPLGRRRAVDLVKHPSGARLFPVGRLDADSTGLLLLTNDGKLANRLTHPRYHIAKVYEVTVKGSLDAGALKDLEKGLFLHDRRRDRGSKTARSRLRLIKRDRDRTRLRMELREGRNRQIRRMMERVGYPVQKLRRIASGPLKLEGLRVGEWRPLTPRELAALKRAAYREERGAGAQGRRGAGKRIAE
ncbi:MAG: pseudouridine synthase [Planctomycetota bacterium]|jgi:pseudouridine synthase